MTRNVRRTFAALALAMMAAAVVASPLGAAPGDITEYRLPALDRIPTGIVVGPDKNLWFTEVVGNNIGRIRPDGSVLKEFPLPRPASFPFSITSGSDGNLWFTERLTDSIGVITTHGRIVKEIALPVSPVFITTGQDGNVWFTSQLGGQVGRVTPAGKVTLFKVAGAPLGITAGPDGAVWFADPHPDNMPGKPDRIGRITPSGKLTEYTLPGCPKGKLPTRLPFTITTGPDHNLWFTEVGPCLPGQGYGSGFGVMTPQGRFVKEFHTPTPDSGPSGITTLGRFVWFTENQTGKVGKVSVNGTFTEYPLAPDSRPQAIVPGPDNKSLWFTESGLSLIGRISAG